MAVSGPGAIDLQAEVDCKRRASPNPTNERHPAFTLCERPSFSIQNAWPSHCAGRSMLDDACYAVRNLIESPAIGAIAILTFALGIGPIPPSSAWPMACCGVPFQFLSRIAW